MDGPYHNTNFMLNAMILTNDDTLYSDGGDNWCTQWLSVASHLDKPEIMRYMVMTHQITYLRAYINLKSVLLKHMLTINSLSHPNRCHYFTHPFMNDCNTNVHSYKNGLRLSVKPRNHIHLPSLYDKSKWHTPMAATPYLLCLNPCSDYLSVNSFALPLQTKLNGWQTIIKH